MVIEKRRWIDHVETKNDKKNIENKCSYKKYREEFEEAVELPIMEHRNQDEMSGYYAQISKYYEDYFDRNEFNKIFTFGNDREVLEKYFVCR